MLHLACTSSARRYELPALVSESRLLPGRQALLLGHEREPAIVLLQAPRVVAEAVELADAGSLAAAVAQLAVLPHRRVAGRLGEECAQQVLGLELDLDGAAGRQLGLGTVHELAHGGRLLARREREQRADAVEEHAVVADEVDHGEGLLAARGVEAEAAAELLQEHHRRFGGAEHHHSVDRRDVDALVEEDDRADRAELPGCELRQRALSFRAAGTRVDRGDCNAPRGKPLPRAVGVRDRAAEDQRPLAAMVLSAAMETLHARLDLRGPREGFGIETAVSPRDRIVVDGIGEAEVAERRQMALDDPASEIGAVGEVVVEGSEDVAGIGAFGRRGQPEQKEWTKVAEDAAVGARIDVMHLVDDRVVESAGRNCLEVLAAAELHHRAEDHVTLEPVAVADVPAEAHVRELAAEGARCLAQDLDPMGEKEDPRHPPLLCAKAIDVAGCEHGLAEPGREHDERALAALLLARAAERVERLFLHLP
jgi:hypothetical protein